MMNTTNTMAIGQKLPNVIIKTLDHGHINEQEMSSLFDGKTVLFFGVPGAFTPTCSNSHLPSFTKNYEAIMAKGVDHIICLAVNDPFVLTAWAKDTNSMDKITFIADGGGTLTKALGLDWDGTDVGLGIRSKRFSMIVKDGTVHAFHVESNPGVCSISDAQTILADL